MKLAVDTFRGEVPRLSPRLLPVNAAQEATNCRMQSGDLESWRQFLLTKTLANTGVVQTIYLLNGSWLSWNAQVDVARGVIAGDNTFRIYLTAPSIYTTPRWTNYTMATTGAEPFPVTTRPLGVPGPTVAPGAVPGIGSVPTTDVTDNGSQLSTTWTHSPVAIAGTTYSEVTQDAVTGHPAPSYKLVDQDNVANGTYLYRNFGTEGNVVVQFTSDFNAINSGLGHFAASWRISCDAAGAGCVVKISDSTGAANLFIGNSDGWGHVGSWLLTVPMADLDGTGAHWYKAVVTSTLNNTGTTTVKAQIYDGVTLVVEGEVTSSFSRGGYCGFEGVTADTNGYNTYYDNIEVLGTGSTSVVVSTATSYVYTFVNDIGQQSAPSPASSTVLRPDGVAVTVTTPTTTPVVGDAATYGITTKRIYRSVSGSTGTAFVFVASIALATASYVDELDDSEIAGNDVLETDDWDLPPAGLEGIIALPNGIMAGFYRNLLCLSASGNPHAWPVSQRLPVDTDIVGIGNIDNTVVIGTKSFVYTATGNDPSSYSMSKPGDPQSCVSKRSMTFLPDVGANGGVAFASPDGWIVCAGSAGQVSNATKGIFNKRQWTALAPSSLIAAVHDGVLFFFTTGQTPDAGYALDTAADGAGLARLSFHATAVHVDPLTDALYLVLDINSEPTAGALPLASTAVVPNGLKIYQFDAGASDMVFRWRGKLNLSPYPLALTIAQVRALSFTNLLWRIYGDGVLLLEKVVGNPIEFTVPALDTYDKYELELIGTNSVFSMQAAEDVAELV